MDEVPNTLVLTILSFIPFLLFSFLLIFRNTAILKVAALTLVVTFVIALGVWKMFPFSAVIASGKGILVAVDILLIVFGAIFFLEIIKKRGILESISYYLSSLSGDYRIQVITLAWFLEAFIEATAGFGTPVAVVAPMLVALGISPLNSLVISLLGNSTSVAFGAVGTPTRIGFASINMPHVGVYASIFNFVGIMVPVAMLWIATSGQKNRRQQFMECLPAALMAGVAYVVFALVATPFGDEFPSIVGSLAGFAAFVLALKLKFLTPVNIRTVDDNKQKLTGKKPLWLTAFPYVALIVSLILGKIVFSSTSIAVPLFNHSISLFNPGFAFFIGGGLFVIITKIGFKETLLTAKDAFGRSLNPFLVTAIMSILVQVMERSSNNLIGLGSMTSFIATVFTTHLLPLWTPFIGAFGAFITGSATVSNLLFGKTLALSASSLGFAVDKLLGVLLAGAAAGNMAAISDVSAGIAVVNNKDVGVRSVMRGTVPICLIYLLAVGIAGLILLG